jgi:hypothetical protein
MRFRDRQTRVTQATVALFHAGRSWTGCRCGRDPRIQATRPSIGIRAAPALIRSRLRTALDLFLVPGRESHKAHNPLFELRKPIHIFQNTPKTTPMVIVLPNAYLNSGGKVPTSQDFCSRRSGSTLVGRFLRRFAALLRPGSSAHHRFQPLRRPSNGTLHDFVEMLVIAMAAALSDCDTIEDIA